MKKFKVIEKSRFLDKGMMGKMQGGYFSTVCTREESYKSFGCTSTSQVYQTCMGVAADNFTGGSCLGNKNTCGPSMSYNDSYCYGIIWFSTSCGKKETY